MQDNERWVGSILEVPEDLVICFVRLPVPGKVDSAFFGWLQSGCGRCHFELDNSHLTHCCISVSLQRIYSEALCKPASSDFRNSFSQDIGASRALPVSGTTTEQVAREWLQKLEA